MTDLLSTLYLFNTILNVLSTTCTMLFLLYRFTSFFSYIVGFVKFCGRLFNGVVYVKNKIVNYYYPYDYTSIQCSEEDLEEGRYNDDGIIYNTVENNTKKSFISRCKDNIYNFFFPKKKEYNTLPIYHTRASYIISDEEREDNTTIEQRILNQQINNLLDQDNIEISDSIPLLWLGDRITDENVNSNVNFNYNENSIDLNNHGTQYNDDPDVPTFSTLLKLNNHSHADNHINNYTNNHTNDTLGNNDYMYNPITTTQNYNDDNVSNNSSTTYTTSSELYTSFRPLSRVSNLMNESVQSLDLINKFKDLTLKNENFH